MGKVFASKVGGGGVAVQDTEAASGGIVVFPLEIDGSHNNGGVKSPPVVGHKEMMLVPKAVGGTVLDGYEQGRQEVDRS